jgi:hypothetical protein
MAYGRRNFVGLTGGAMIGWSLGATLLAKTKTTIDFYGMSLLVWPKDLKSLDVLMPQPKTANMSMTSKFDTHAAYLLVRNGKFDPKHGAKTVEAPEGFVNFTAWPLNDMHLEVAPGATSAITLTNAMSSGASKPAAEAEWANLQWIPNLSLLKVGPVYPKYLASKVDLGTALGARVHLAGGKLSSQAPNEPCLRREVYELGSLPRQVYSDVCRFTPDTEPTHLVIRPLNDPNAKGAKIALKNPDDGDIVVVNYPEMEPTKKPPCCSNEHKVVHHFKALYALVSEPGSMPLPMRSDCLKLTNAEQRLIKTKLGRTVRCLKAQAPQD